MSPVYEFWGNTPFFNEQPLSHQPPPHIHIQTVTVHESAGEARECVSGRELKIGAEVQEKSSKFPPDLLLACLFYELKTKFCKQQ